MKAYWNAFNAWIDARVTRERVLLFASAIIVPGVLLHALLVQPVLAERKRMSQETLTEQVEIGKMAVQLKAMVNARGADPDAALKARLAQSVARLAELQREADTQVSELVSPEKMAGVLEKILASSPRIQVVAVKVLPRTTISFDKAVAVEPPGQPQVAGAQAAQERKPNEIFRHGVEVSVRGNYLDLVAYLKQIESQPVRMFWDSVNLTVGEYPMVTMRVLVYTISLEKAWLTV